jgi:putative transposase
MDVLLIDRETGLIIGRACLTLAIDVYSRMVVGYCVSLDAPSCNLVGICIANSVLPKTKWIERYGIKSEWPCEGLFDHLHTDNAGEFSGPYMETLCKQYKIDFTWRPLDGKNYGGNVERLIGTICKRMHCLPGTTFSDVKERGEYPSEKQAAMTLEDLEKWLAVFICDVYHNTVHSALDGQTPLERYREGILGSSRMAGFGQPRKISPDMVERFRVDMLPFVKRTIQREGLSIEGLKYNDFGLSKYRKEAPGDTAKKFIIRFDPGSMRIVYLWDDNAQEHVPIPFANTGRDDISLWENRAIKQIIRNRGGDPRNEYAVIEGQREMDRIAEEAVATTKASRRLKVKKVRDKQGAIHPTLPMNVNNHLTSRPSEPQRVVNGEPDETAFQSETTQDNSDTPGITPFITANGYNTKFRTRRK